MQNTAKQNYPHLVASYDMGNEMGSETTRGKLNISLGAENISLSGQKQSTISLSSTKKRT